ncbi:DUF1329 domain-containing protein [Cupriavidus basilensis]
MQSIRKKALALCVIAALSAAAAMAGAAELPAGTVIDKGNIDKVKNDTFDGHTIASLLTDRLEWQIRNTGLKIPLGHAKPVQLDPKYIEATKKNAGKAQFDEKTREVTGWEAGIPFPEVSQRRSLCWRQADLELLLRLAGGRCHRQQGDVPDGQRRQRP